MLIVRLPSLSAEVMKRSTSTGLHGSPNLISMSSTSSSSSSPSGLLLSKYEKASSILFHCDMIERRIARASMRCVSRSNSVGKPRSTATTGRSAHCDAYRRRHPHSRVKKCCRSPSVLSCSALTRLESSDGSKYISPSRNLASCITSSRWKAGPASNSSDDSSIAPLMGMERSAMAVAAPSMRFCSSRACITRRTVSASASERSTKRRPLS